MKLFRIVLASWFILWGLLSISNFQFQQSGFILGVLAVAGGILWLLDK